MKNTLRTTNCEQRTHRAFTLIELVVAVALLAVVFAFAGVIFRVGIDSYRISAANAEIMQNLRAITDQLNVDFKGAISSPGGRIHFDPNKSYIDNKFIYTAADMANRKDVRSDGIIFFANGDFQSTLQYNGNTVVGNVACIFYALANVTTYGPEEVPDPKKKILMRRQTILTSDFSLPNYGLIDRKEYCNTQTLAGLITDPAFDANTLMDDKNLDLNNQNDLVNYMAKGVDDFTIQYVGWEPSPPIIKNFNEWRPENSEIVGWPNSLYPIAFKFTFTLYDSKAVIKQGRKFTYIVYVGD
ncbi:MAG: prepilin-type N-terminal cleavage/methylation domain-containing protein [Phycisphaerae bacterium]|jgi:prepilin-type N-terminal cleavage/methylation domain-containing protein